MTTTSKLMIALAASLLSAACLAQPAPPGVQYAAGSQPRGDANLQLNGGGIRYRGPFKVYSASLYLGRKAGTLEEVLGAAGPKRLSMTMLRDIDATELGKLFIRGVEDNLDRSSFSRVVPGLMRMSQLFSDHRKLAAGDSIAIEWLPGVGTVISVRGTPQGEPFREPEFYAALMRIWLGPVPADWQLKERLLGRDARG